LAEQVTIPEGIVNGPERDLPKNSVFNVEENSLTFKLGKLFYSLLAGNALGKHQKRTRVALCWLNNLS